MLVEYLNMLLRIIEVDQRVAKGTFEFTPLQLAILVFVKCCENLKLIGKKLRMLETSKNGKDLAMLGNVKMPTITKTQNAWNVYKYLERLNI